VLQYGGKLDEEYEELDREQQLYFPDNGNRDLPTYHSWCMEALGGNLTLSWKKLIAAGLLVIMLVSFCSPAPEPVYAAEFMVWW
jgi:hypothetical protein